MPSASRNPAPRTRDDNDHLSRTVRSDETAALLSALAETIDPSEVARLRERVVLDQHSGG
jgi:hypothetical protein